MVFNRTTNQIKGLFAGTEVGDAITLQQADVQWRAYPVDLLTTGQTVILPVQNNADRFIPTHAYIELVTVTGALTAPIIRIGNNGSFNNVCPLFTCTGLTTQYNVLSIPLVTSLNSIDVSATAISVDVQTAGGVATIAVANVVLLGVIRTI